MTGSATPPPAVAVGHLTDPLTVGPTGAGSGEALARHAMSWHRRTLTETGVSQAITGSTLALIRAARGAAILALTAPGELTILGAHGVLPELNLPAPGPPDHLQDERVETGWHDTFGHLRSPGRWPVFTAPAGPTGQCSILCTPLGSGRTMFGTLIVAADDPDAFDAPTAAMLTVLAMHASDALAAARDRATLHDAFASRAGRPRTSGP